MTCLRMHAGLRFNSGRFHQNEKGKNVILKTEDFQVGDVLFRFVANVGWKSFATVLSREGNMLGLRYDDPSYIGIIAIFEHLLVRDGVLASVSE